jgi:hypothetical protein
MVTMSQKSSVLQPAKSVSQALTPDTINVWRIEIRAVSTPEEKCIDFPEQKYISEAGKKGR